MWEDTTGALESTRRFACVLAGKGIRQERPTHLIGLLLGTEEDWSAAFETLMARIAPRISHGGATHEFALERVTIEPFDLRAKPRHKLVIDRLAHWYEEFMAEHLPDLDEILVEYIESPVFDTLSRVRSCGDVRSSCRAVGGSG